MNKIIVDIKNLSIFYKGSSKPAVDDISLQIFEKDIFGLLGPNGAGKTTTISYLCGIIKRNSGTALIDGLSIEHNLPEIKNIIGVVPQEIALYKELTSWENLRYFGNIYGLKGNVLKDKIEEYLILFGFDIDSKKRIGEFSGGMKRRLNIIAGLLHSPKILFLDEPTVGVDVQSRTLIIDVLKKLNNEGMTLIYTSHDLEEAQNLCNRIAIIDSSRIICNGEINDLINNFAPGKNLEEIFLQLTGRRVRD